MVFGKKRLLSSQGDAAAVSLNDRWAQTSFYKLPYEQVVVVRHHPVQMKTLAYRIFIFFGRNQFFTVSDWTRVAYVVLL